jgi:predicted nucleic acid-binding protein
VNIFVVDASVAAKWFTEEDYSLESLAFLRNNEKLFAPDTFLLEMDNLICKWIRRGIVTNPEGDEIRDELRCQPIEFFPFRELLDYAFEIASRTGCSLYDCLYLALAVSLKGKMATADRRLCERLDQTLFSKYVVFISEIP